MKAGRHQFRALIQAFHLLATHPWRNLWLLLLLTILLIVQFCGIMVTIQGESWLRRQLPEPTLILFMQGQASETQTHALWDALANQTSVASFDTRSPQEALNQLRTIPGLLPALNQLEHNPIGSTFIVHLRHPDATHLAQLEQELSLLHGIAAIHSSHHWAQRLDQLISFLKLVSLGTTLSACLIWVTLTAGMARHQAEQHARENKLMRQLGASQMYLARSYGYEGLLIGVLSSSLAVLLLWAYWKSHFSNPLPPAVPIQFPDLNFLATCISSTIFASSIIFVIAQWNPNRK